MFGSKASTMPGSSTACRGRDVLSRETICPSPPARCLFQQGRAGKRTV